MYAVIRSEAWTEEALEQGLRTVGEDHDIKLGKIAQPLRAALTGKTVSPSVSDIMQVLGKDQTLVRIRAA